MKIVSIEPTPNPNSMKLNLDHSLESGVKYTYVLQFKDRYSDFIQQLLNVSGVRDVFHVADFMAIQRDPNSDWEQILLDVRRVFQGDANQSAVQSDHSDGLNFGEVQVSVQFFRRIPMLIRLTQGQNQKRVALDPRFQEAVNKASKASKNMLLERRWNDYGSRYGALDDVGEEISVEIEALYDQTRLDELVDQAFKFKDGSRGALRFNSDELNERLHSSDWRERFAALEQIGADGDRINDLIQASQDLRMAIRRLAIVLLGLLETPKALEALCHALQDSTVAVRRTAGDALTDLGDKRAIPFMAETLKDDNKLVRWRAARFMFEHGDKSILDQLKECQNDSEFEVKMQVQQAIERIEGGHSAQGTVWQQLTRERQKDIE